VTIEIKQLVIRAVVDPRSERASAAAADVREGARGETRFAPPAAEPQPGAREALVADCVREVLRELRKVRER
jgi:hypothetical protein